MSKQSAFDREFAEAVSFTDGYGSCISALQYKTEAEALDYFRKYEHCQPEGWGRPEAISVRRNWVKWHGGINDEGEMRNGWWINPDYEGKKGAKPVWECVIDWHMFRNGHSFEQAKDEHGEPKCYPECVTCGATR